MKTFPPHNTICLPLPHPQAPSVFPLKPSRNCGFSSSRRRNCAPLTAPPLAFPLGISDFHVWASAVLCLDELPSVESGERYFNILSKEAERGDLLAPPPSAHPDPAIGFALVRGCGVRPRCADGTKPSEGIW